MEDMALVLEKKERVFINLAVMESIINKLIVFMENEARSCSMDFGCITPIYTFRMLGGQYSLTDIEKGLAEIKMQGTFGL